MSWAMGAKIFVIGVDWVTLQGPLIETLLKDHYHPTQLLKPQYILSSVCYRGSVGTILIHNVDRLCRLLWGSMTG